ncbi:MAG: multicopper oxidase family protein [Acidobacteria bacterium]|nr:multicopper oxidase family protein [Acidobacteriota bacterium]
MSRLLVTLLLAVAAFSPSWRAHESALPAQQQGQQQQGGAGEMQVIQHEGHMMGPVEAAAWRMPPMGNMPMMPGLEMAVPPDDPYLPGVGIDPEMFPMARPNEVLDLEDGDEIDLRAMLVRRSISGRMYVMYGYNGQYPGPLIRAPQGATIVVNFTNDIEMPTTVHWHGLRLDNRFDGVPDVTQPAVRPGESFRYEVHFRDSGIYWYHPHVREDIQQDLGLYGNMMVAPPNADYYGPAHREEVVILDDILIDGNGLMPFGASTPTHALMGRFGNVMLVNGATDYAIDVKRGEVVRFFLTNVANSRTFNVTFGNARVKVVASDISKFEREQWVQSVVIAPAERYVVDVLFDRPGEVLIENTIQAIDHFRGEFFPHVDLLGRVTVSAELVDEDLSARFGDLREHDDVQADIGAYREFFDKAPDIELVASLRIQNLPLPIVLSMEFEKGLYVPPMEWNDTMPMMNWLSTGKQVTWILRDRNSGAENMDNEWNFKVGDLVKIRIFNDPETIHPMNHPIHIHGQRFLITEIDGVANPNLVWKDTAIVPVGSTVDFLLEITNPGDWMMHCHISEHLHAGMMLRFHVDE